MSRSRAAYESAWRRRAWLAAFAVLVVGVGVACRAQRPEPSNILLITVDTLRADHLSAWGYPRPTSPFIDQLAAEGVRFDQATVQWPKTGPSFASIFTSTYPRDNGIVRRIGIPLPSTFHMLAEELKGHGYSTHAVVANGALGSEFHFNQGFDTYIETWKVPSADTPDPNDATRVTTLALETAEHLPDDKPFFLWVHYLDPHAPYLPPVGYRDRFQGDRWFKPEETIPFEPERARVEVGGIGSEQVRDGRTDLAFYVARYDAEIAYVDAEIRRLWRGMERMGRLKSTLTAFTADHGESLGEHQYYFDHGRFGFQSCLHVPLILHEPGVLASRVVTKPVPLLDLSPTLLQAAGMSLTDGRWMQGRSLWQRMTGEVDDAEGAPPVVFSEAGYATDDNWQKIARAGRYKLILAPWRHANRWIGGKDVLFTLYDLDKDPGELHDVRAEHPEVFQRLHDAMAQWLRRHPARLGPPGRGEIEPGDEAMTPETRKLLHTLGYL
jgi:arylsulfatase